MLKRVQNEHRDLPQWTGFEARRTDEAALPGSGRREVRIRRRRRITRDAGRLFLLAVDSTSLAVAAWAVSWQEAPMAFPLVAVAVLAASGAYRFPLNLRMLEHAPWMLQRLGIALIMLAPAAALANSTRGLLEQAAVGAAGLVVGRVFGHAVLRRARRRNPSLLEPALILGAGAIACELAEALTEHPDHGLRPIGYLDDESTDSMPVPYRGRFEELAAVSQWEDVRHLVVAFSPTREHDLVEVLRTSRRAGLSVHVVPRFFELGQGTTGDGEEIWGIPLRRLRPDRHPVAWRAKRALDVGLALSALLVLSPVMLALAVAVKFSSPGPILFRQQRVAQDGRRFELLKFRSMEINDDCDRTWSVAADPRQTAVGSFLRRTSLDELPQFYNVLRGDMSVIGPRPERPRWVETFSGSVDGYADRHRAPVGLTGWAQVHGLRGDTSIPHRVRFDNQYIENWSLWRDLTIAVRTLAVLFRRDPR